MSTSLTYSQPTCQLEIAAEFLPFSQKLRRVPVRSLHFRLDLGEKLQFEGNDRQLYQLKTLVNEYIEAFLSHHQTPTEVTAEGFVLRSRSPLEHELHLPDGQVILLQLTELYDLVTVLDDWSAVMEPLPELVERAQSTFAQIPIWAKSAAVAVGVVAAFTLVTQRWLIPPASMVVTSPEVAREETNLPPLVMPSPLPESPETPQLAPLPSPPPAAPETSTLVPLPSPPEMPPPATLPAPPPPAVAPPPPPVAQQPPSPQTPDQNNVVVQAPPDRAPAGIEPAPMIIPPTETTAVPATTLREVKAYFQDRWRPPASLDTSLEYRIVLNPDGTLAQALPLNGAAVRFIDRTPIPLRESPLASPFGGDRPVLLRLVLMPSGTVQVFGEN